MMVRVSLSRKIEVVRTTGGNNKITKCVGALFCGHCFDWFFEVVSVRLMIPSFCVFLGVNVSA